MKRPLFLIITVLCSLFSVLCFNVEAAQVEIKKTEEGGYQLFVDGEPFLVKGVIYQPIPPGGGYYYNFWQDLEVVSKDAQLMKKAGFNVVRFYAPGEDLEQVRKVVQEFHKNGIYTVMSHWLGFWNYPCPFYGAKEFQEEVKSRVLKVVEALKEEEGILMWILGNENNYSFSGKVNPWSCPEADDIKEPSQKINKKAEIYYSFVDNIAKQIHTIDKAHPVGLGNGELITLDIASEFAKDLDFLALIFYRGKKFGNIFDSAGYIFDKPILISEMGCDSYDAYRNQENQDFQADFLLSQWIDIYKNSPFNNKEGNCLGGIIFEWNDEWWKHNSSDSSRWGYHDTLGGWSNGSYYFDIKAPRNLNMNEEWFGILSFEKDEQGNFIKKPRKVYFVLKEFFQGPQNFLDNE